MPDPASGFRDKLSSVPDKPGVYLFRDSRQKVLYVGKAKGLKSRLRSYFQKSPGLDERKAAMVKSIHDFEFTVTGNELEALVLEANLIKQFRPRFNVLLRDDKNYPYLRLTVQEQWPRLEVVRRVKKDGARYYGPYIPSSIMWSLLSFIRNTFRIPNCRHALDKRMRPCIQHQIGKCSAPCAGQVDRDDYLAMIREIRLLLEGKNRGLLDELTERMQQLSDEMRFEEAAVLRDRIRAIEKISETQKIVDPNLGNIDVLGMHRAEGRLGFKLLFIRNGIMVGSREFLMKDAADESDGRCIQQFLEQFYSHEVGLPDELLCSTQPDDSGLLMQWLGGRHGSRVKISVPRRGTKKRLVEMAVENAEIAVGTLAAPDEALVLQEIGLRLGLDHPPESIGAFDISNLGSGDAVGAFVLWEAGSFRRDRYRHIRMQDVAGPDDYAMMREMIRRTVRSAGPDLPDLIIIDGGREHLNAGSEALNAEGISDKALIGLAKDPDRAFLPAGAVVLLDDSGPSSLLLRRIRDEVHRFAVRYLREMRSKKAFETALDAIYGIGRKRRFALLDHFGTIDAIRRAGADEISRVSGFTAELAARVVEALAGEQQKESS